MIGILVRLTDDFSVVRETLERIGIKNGKTKKFYPSCYCLPTKEEGVYTIVHFKELFGLFGKDSNFDECDKLRQKTIVQLMTNWNLISPVTPIDEIMGDKINVLKHSEKKEYEIVHKFRFHKKIVVE